MEIMKRNESGDSGWRCRSMALRSLEGLRASERQITHRFTEPAAQDQACKHLSQTGKEPPQRTHGSLCGALASKQTQHSEDRSIDI